MSQEVFEMIQKMDTRRLETQLVVQCAPVITGIKISNLLIIDREMAGQLGKVLKNSGISYYMLLEREDKVTFLLYMEKQLISYLKKEDVSCSMKEYGYDTMDLECILTIFRNHYQDYMNREKEFPHEMGLLLGYPVEDVDGFIKHKGKEFLYSGYWKVYEKVEEKVILFQRYEEAREVLLQMLTHGWNIRDMVEASQAAPVKRRIGAA